LANCRQQICKVDRKYSKMTLNIYRVCEQFPPAKGGLSSGMADLSLAQHKMGHNITVITRATKNDNLDKLNPPYNVIKLDSKRILDFSWKAYELIKQLSAKPDIVHYHGPAAFLYLMRKTQKDPPLVFTMHTVRKYEYSLFKNLPDVVKDFEKKMGSPVICKPKFYNFLSRIVLKEFFIEKYICKRADFIIVVAKYFSEQIQKYYGVPYHKICVAYNGSKFDPMKIPDVDIFHLQKLKIDPSRQIILYVGRTDWVKRVHLLIESMPLLLKKYPNSFLVIAGEGEQDKDLARLIKKLNLSEYVIMLGWIPHNELAMLYKNANCFCLPSYWEGLSKALLEAISEKIPVIATDNLSNREVLQDGEFGWLVSKPSPEKWSEVIETVFSNENQADTKKRCDGAFKYLNENFRWKHVAERIEIAYQKLLSNSS